MKNSLTIIPLVLGVLLLSLGLLFLCAAARQPGRLLLAGALLVIGAALAAWSGINLRRARQLDPEQLSDQVTALVEKNGQAEISLSEVVAGLAVPDEAAEQALDLLVEKGQALREYRADRWIYLFPGLKESKVVRRCSHCGREYSVKTPLYECPNCGGQVELVKT